MCGIMGGIGPALDFVALTNILSASEDRGKDATGLTAWNYRRRNEQKPLLLKHNVKSSIFCKEYDIAKMLEEINPTTVIGHTRAATVGTCNKNENNHPIVSDDSRYILVHNGCIDSTEKVDGYKYIAEVDSERALALIEKFGDQGLKKICGSAALAWAPKGDKSMKLWRNINPIVVGHKPKDYENWYFASTREILSKGIPDIEAFEVQEHRLLQLWMDHSLEGGAKPLYGEIIAPTPKSYNTGTSPGSVYVNYAASIVTHKDYADTLTDTITKVIGVPVSSYSVFMALSGKHEDKAGVTISIVTPTERPKLIAFLDHMINIDKVISYVVDTASKIDVKKSPLDDAVLEEVAN